MNKIFIIILACMILIGCKKNPFDYRTKYVGDYKFEISVSAWNPVQGEFDTSYSVDGRIDYGSDRNTISINFSGSNSPQVFTIYEDGTIENKCQGEFESAHKVVYSCYWASPGAHTSERVVGEKK